MIRLQRAAAPAASTFAGETPDDAELTEEADGTTPVEAATTEAPSDGSPKEPPAE